MNAANGMVVGVEDIGIGSGRSDGDYNDLIVAINRLNMPLF